MKIKPRVLLIDKGSDGYCAECLDFPCGVRFPTASLALFKCFVHIMCTLYKAENKPMAISPIALRQWCGGEIIPFEHEAVFDDKNGDAWYLDGMDVRMIA